MNSTSFSADIKRGKIGEQIFIEDFLLFMGIKYKDVTGCQAFQVIDADFLSSIGLYEIKTNYRDNHLLIFEDYSNNDPKCGPITQGWIYKTKADLVVFVSKATRHMIFLPLTERFKRHYQEKVIPATTLNNNSYSESKGRKWRSAYRKVPFSMLRGFISQYKCMADKSENKGGDNDRTNPGNPNPVDAQRDAWNRHRYLNEGKNPTLPLIPRQQQNRIPCV